MNYFPLPFFRSQASLLSNDCFLKKTLDSNSAIVLAFCAGLAANAVEKIIRPRKNEMKVRIQAPYRYVSNVWWKLRRKDLSDIDDCLFLVDIDEFNLL